MIFVRDGNSQVKRNKAVFSNSFLQRNVDSGLI